MDEARSAVSERQSTLLLSRIGWFAQIQPGFDRRDTQPRPVNGAS